MKRDGTRIRSIAAGAALLLLFITGPATGDDVLPAGSCIYSGNTHRTCTTSVHLVQSVDFFVSTRGWVDDVPLDSFAALDMSSILQKFRSDVPHGLSIIFR